MLGSVRRRGETILVAAIVGAVAAGGPAVAGQIVVFAKSAGNANTVNKIGASKTPRAGMLVPLNAKGQFPAAVLAAGRGAAGSAGPAGPQGLQGLLGLQGAPGTAGANGASGSQGLKGDTGTAGPNGASGSQGLKGETGTAGPNGASGSQGLKGETGTAGANGASGSQGLKGETGTAGANGASGSQGLKGETGTAGANGASGSQGDPGTNGTNGPQGATGPAGADGATGPQGPAGGLVYPALIDINPTTRPFDEHLWGRIEGGGSWNNTYRSSFVLGVETKTAYLEWRLPIGAGTWDLEVTHVTSPDAGILTLSLDGVDIGSVDSYAPAPIVLNVRGDVPGITVSTSGMHVLRVRTATQNPASSGFYGYLTWLRLVQR